MRFREQQQNQILRQHQPMMPGQIGQFNNLRRSMIPPNLQKTALQNNNLLGSFFLFLVEKKFGC